MFCELSHSIIVKNLKQKYFHEVVLLVGSIENSCDHQSVAIESHGEFEIVQLFNKTFKSLIQLKSGSNEVKVTYCSYEKTINLTYEKVDPVIYDVQPLYVIPRGFDELIDENVAMRKINLCLKLTQCVIGAKFTENGSDSSMSYALNDCEIFNSSLTVDFVRRANQYELYDEIAKELITKYGSDVIKKRKFVAFISCTRFLGLSDDEEYTHENIKRKTQANPALGVGFLALLGTGTFYSWPTNLRDVQRCFQDKTIVDTKVLLDDSNYRKTYGGNFSTSLGSILHELGHIFDLGHTESGLMGNDIDYVHRFFISENFTEIMPKRMVSKCQKSSAKEISPNSRLTKIKKGGDYLEKYRHQKNNDMTFFEPNCMLTLMYHRWFTQETSDSFVEFDEKERLVQSNDQLAMVELRDEDSLLKNFNDLSKDYTQTFKFPSDVSLEKMTIFVVTKTGFTYKT